MATNTDILNSISKLEKSSRLAIPLGLLAFFAIAAMLYLSAMELQQTQQQIEQARLELNDLKAEAAKVVAETQARLRTADQTIEEASINATTKDLAIRLQTAREDIAVADASLTGAKIQIKALRHPSNTSIRYGTMSIDVFFCESSGPIAKESADRVAALKGDSIGRWRVRPLSTTINASSGYRIFDNVIRYNQDEVEVAKNLMEDAKKQAGITFRLQETTYPTPGYVSAFICKVSIQ